MEVDQRPFLPPAEVPRGRPRPVGHPAGRDTDGGHDLPSQRENGRRGRPDRRPKPTILPGRDRRRARSPPGRASAPDLLSRTLDGIAAIPPVPQDHSQATLAPKLAKEDGRIDWSARRDRDRAAGPGLHAPAVRVHVSTGRRLILLRGTLAGSPEIPGRASGRPSSPSRAPGSTSPAAAARPTGSPSSSPKAGKRWTRGLTRRADESTAGEILG